MTTALSTRHVWLASISTPGYLHGYFAMSDENAVIWYYHFLRSAEIEPLLAPPAFGIDVTPPTIPSYLIFLDEDAITWYVWPLPETGLLQLTLDPPSGAAWDLAAGANALVLATVGGHIFVKLYVEAPGQIQVVADDGPGLEGDVQELIRLHFSVGSVCPVFATLYWLPKLYSPGSVTTSVLGSPETIIDTTSGVPRYGSVDLAIGDRALDASLAIDLRTGADIRLYDGRDNQVFDDFTLRYQAEIRAIEHDVDTAHLVLTDKFRGFAVPVQQNLYHGTGGLDGGPELAGRGKPIVLGTAYNIQPVLVDVNGGEPIYQVNDGNIAAITGYDNAVTLLNTGSIQALGLSSIYDWEPVAGRFTWDAVNGYVRLGVEPTGIFTADVIGASGESEAINALRSLAQRGGLRDPEDMDDLQLLSLLATRNVRISLWIEDGSTVQIADLMTQICRSILCFWYFTPAGIFTVKPFRTDPAVMLTPPITDAHVASFHRRPEPTVYWKVRLWYQQNHTVQKYGDFDVVISDARKAFVSQEWRYISLEDAAIREAYPDAQVLEWQTCLGFEAAAVQFAAGLFAIVREPHHVDELTLYGQQFTYDVGDYPPIQLSRFVTAASLPQILEITEDMSNETTRMVVWS